MGRWGASTRAYFVGVASGVGEHAKPLLLAVRPRAAPRGTVGVVQGSSSALHSFLPLAFVPHRLVQCLALRRLHGLPLPKELRLALAFPRDPPALPIPRESPSGAGHFIHQAASNVALEEAAPRGRIIVVLAITDELSALGAGQRHEHAMLAWRIFCLDNPPHTPARNWVCIGLW